MLKLVPNAPVAERQEAQGRKVLADLRPLRGGELYEACVDARLRAPRTFSIGLVLDGKNAVLRLRYRLPTMDQQVTDDRVDRQFRRRTDNSWVSPE